MRIKRSLGALVAAGLCLAMVSLAPATDAATTGATNLEFGMGGASQLFGNPNPGSRDNGYETLNELGVVWLRVDVHWDDVQPTKTGGFNWTATDQIMNDAKAHGLKVMAILQRTPAWARPAGTANTNPPVSAADLEGWRLFNKAFAVRYTTKTNVKVHAIEVWNEPNHPLFWTGANWAPRYVALLKKSYTEFKVVNAATTIVTGGLAPAGDSTNSRTARTWLKDFYAAGGKGSFDAVGHHPYTWPNLPSDNKGTAGWVELVRDDLGGAPSLRTTMTTNGDAAKKIWNTEFGYPSSWGGESRQALAMSDAVNLWKTFAWAGPFFAYSYKDDPDAFGANITSGLLVKGEVRKQAFTAYQTAIRNAVSNPAPVPPKSTVLLNLGGGNASGFSGCVPGYCAYRVAITGATWASKANATVYGSAPGFEPIYRDWIQGLPGKTITIDVPVPAAGRYKTSFVFADFASTAAAQRQLNLTVSSVDVQSPNYDIFANAGRTGGVSTKVITQTITGTTLRITITPVKGVPIVNALVVERVP